MIFVTMLTFVGTSFVSREGARGLGYTALRALMVLPAWPLTGSAGWWAAGVGGSGLVVVCAVAASRRPIGEGVDTQQSPKHSYRQSRRARAK
jgi:hypothetical protein